MKNTFSLQPTDHELLPVCFHNHHLFLVEHDSEPYVPMRPVVDGMGLDWKSQYAKLSNNRERWASVVLNTTEACHGKRRKFVSIPLRKLPGFLSTINPVRVKNELRPRIVKFQNECDNVLWDYWNDKMNKKKEEPEQPATLTPEQQRGLQKAVSKRIGSSGGNKTNFPRVWNTVKDYFKVPSYKDIPSSEYEVALKFIKTIPIDLGPTLSGDYSDIDPLYVELLRRGIENNPDVVILALAGAITGNPVKLSL